MNKTKPKQQDKHLYAILAIDGGIKIGISKHPNKRFSQIENSSGRKIIKHYTTIATPNAKKIENLVFKHFGLNRKKGEWFENIKFEDVILHLKFYDYSDELNIY